MAFTAGCLLNRRRGGQSLPQETLSDDLESGERYADGSPPLKPTVIHTENPVRKAPNLFFRLLSRFFNAYPFLVEIWYWNMTYWYDRCGCNLNRTDIVQDLPGAPSLLCENDCRQRSRF